ncbi:TY1B-JR1 [Symbiodinium necroappetens]|uniref:TY1B-JR1 protein n=1 Tax=Symbiodinium necroappetens TaxID=1628268 RepID=A0A813C3V2_9DINO|nr:TY1B-JR1 [Symbiodinium necroappetens]
MSAQSTDAVTLEGEASGPDYGRPRDGSYNKELLFNDQMLEYHEVRSIWMNFGEMFQRRVVAPVVNVGRSLSTSGGGQHSAEGPQRSLLPADVQRAMEVHNTRPSLISPQHHRRQEEDASSSSVNQDMILEEVRRQVAVAMQGRDREVVSLKQKNKELEEALIEANKAMRQSVGAGEAQSSSAVRPEENHGLPDGLNEPPGLGHGGRGDPRIEGGRDKTSTTATSGTSTGVRGDGSGVEPLQLLVQGMRQLQQVYIGKGESRDSELKGTVELPMMPEVASDSAVSFADWLYEVEQAVGGLSDRAAGWFSMCLKNARETYEIYQMSDPLARLTLEPLRPAELQDERWSRLERRVLTLLLATLQRQAKDDAVTHRISNVSGLLFRLHVLYAPGSAAERASILRHLEGSPGTTSVVDTVTALRRWRRLLQRAEEMHVAVPDPSVLLKAIETMAARAIDANPELKFRLSLSKSQLHLQYRPTLENVLRYYNHVSAELQQAAPTRYWRSGFANEEECRVPGEGRTFYLSGQGEDFATGPIYELFFDYNSNFEPGVGAATASNHGVYSGCYGQFHFHVGGVNFGSATTDNDWRTQEISALLQQANAMLNRLTRLQALQVTSETSLQELKVQMAGLGFAEEERMALLDSGASHPFRERARHEDDGVPVRVELAGGRTVTLKQNKAGTLMPTADTENAQDLSTILPMGALVQSLGCELSWTRKNGLKIVHPQFGALKTVVKGNCPLLGETQALDLIHQLEQKKLQELREATAETFLGTLSLSEIKDWNEMFAAYVQTGQRAHLSQALESTGCPLQGLDETLRSLLAVGVDLSEEAGRRYLKALPIRRSQRKSLLSRRWIVKLYGREGESNEPYKVVETDKTVFFDINVHRSKGFSMKGASPMFQALMWAAARGQIEGVLGAPPSNACAELATKQLLVWMVAKEGARRHRQTAPYVVTTLDPEAKWWTSTVWQGFQREYQIPVAQVSPTNSTATYCVASNLELCTEEDENNVGWGPGVTASSKNTMGWSLDFNKMITQGILSWRRRPEPLMMYAAKTEAGGLGLEELRKWRRHIANGHLPYDRRCKTCVETAATGRSHRRVIAPSCYTLSLDLCGPFRTKGETADAKGYRYALVGNYTMPMIEGYKDHKIPEDFLEEEPGDDGGGVGSIPLGSDVLDEVEEPDPEMSENDKRELDESNEEFKRIFKEIGDDIQYQNLYYMIPLKTRLAPEVEAAIRWLLERDIYPTTGEAQVPQTNGRAEQAVKVTIKAKVFGQGGKFDLNNKWDTGCFVGPSTEVRGGYVVRDVNGRYLTTMHMKKDVVNVEEIVGPIEAEAVLPLPSTRLRRKITVVEDGDGVPPPTRDSERGSTSLGPNDRGEVVVPEEDIVPPPTRDSELGSTSLTDLEQEIENLAVGYDLDERYDEEAVLRMFTHGGVSGIRNTAVRLPSTTAFLVKAAKKLTGTKEFAVVAITRGARLRVHRDSHNEPESENTILALTDFRGGGVWVEGLGKEWREVLPGRWVQGGVQPLHLGSPISFSPRRWHETQEFEGDRVVFMTYTPRTSKLKAEDRWRLSELGFEIPERRDLSASSLSAPILKRQQLILDCDGVLEIYDSKPTAEEEAVEEERLDGTLLRANEYQQQMMDEMMDRSTLLQDLLEEEEERLQDLQHLQQGCLETSKQAHGELLHIVDNLNAKIEREHRLRDEGYDLRSLSVEQDSQDYEKLLSELQEDLQVTHTVPLNQVKPVAERWKPAIEKEIKNLFGTNTLKRIKMSEARRFIVRRWSWCGNATGTVGDYYKVGLERNNRLKALKIPYGNGFITLQQSTTDAELWYAVDHCGEEKARGTLLALIITYVDDLFYMGPTKVVQQLHDWVNREWPCSELQWASTLPGVRYLGMEIFQRESGEYEVTQNGYIMDLIRAHDLIDAPQTLLPCPREWIAEGMDQESEDFNESDLKFAQRLVGEQLWLAMRCRPDIHFTVSHMASWVARQPRRVAKVALRVLSYLHKTAEMTLILGQPAEVTDAKVVGFSDASFAPYGGKSYGASVITVEDSPVSWRCGKQTFVMLSIMESELYQATEAAVLLENTAVLLDELLQTRVRRTLCVDNTAATAMIQGGPGSWRTRHLKVRSSYLIQRVQDQELHVEHVDGIKQRADLSTKCHSKARLYTLLKLWRFERLPSEAEAFLVARMTAIVCMIKMLESLPKVTAVTSDEAKEAVKIAGVDELVFVTVLACATAILVWEITKAAGKQLWACLCRPAKGRKARKLRDLAKAAAEVEVDRAFNSEPDVPVRRPTLGAVSSTAWVPSSLDVQQRSIAIQTEDWTRASAPVAVTPPRQVRLPLGIA